MSTFNGIVSEFPRIRIDFFRIHSSQPPPLACFLSHIHSDHLQGLESLKAPFVYCSAATRRLLLRLEKYPHRMNFMKGVLESRKQHYRHLKLVLKAIPLECPTEIELGPRETIRVTLFDANHCPGAVMFLIQGNHSAILYTGDIRSEQWWVNSLVRSPVLLPYTTGLKRLDRIYLDTTFATKDDVYRSFPSKAEGIRELLTKVAQQPPETLFYFSAWTLGYEDVWIALSSFLQSQVHIDSYQSRLYGSLSDADDGINVGENAALNGFYVGNHRQPGCLTTRSDTKIHSCEPGMPCHTELRKARHVVWITPIITRSEEGIVIPEVGAGGGRNDLRQTTELELSNMSSISEMEEICRQIVKEPHRVKRLLSRIESARSSRVPTMSLKGLDLENEDEITLQEFTKRLLVFEDGLLRTKDAQIPHVQSPVGWHSNDAIHFPFSRHSSYTELCYFVSALTPGDIYSCTVDEDTWTEEVSMRVLFGHLCSGAAFRHDEEMRLLLDERIENVEPLKKRRKTCNLDKSQESALTEGSSQVSEIGLRSNEPLESQAANSKSPEVEDVQVIVAAEARDQRELTLPHISAIKSACEVYMIRADFDDVQSSLSDDQAEEHEPATFPTQNHAPISPISISTSAIESQSQDVHFHAGLQLDGAGDERSFSAVKTGNVPESDSPSGPQTRRIYREQAYQAAKITLQTSDSGVWDDLGIRSLGNNGHCEAEEEL